MRVAQGDLPGALAAYEEGLRIARDLAARDKGNAGWARDVSVSLDRVGDVRVAQGDLPGALEAYEESLAIRRDLAARDKGNAGWARDVWCLVLEARRSRSGQRRRRTGPRWWRAWRTWRRAASWSDGRAHPRRRPRQPRGRAALTSHAGAQSRYLGCTCIVHEFTSRESALTVEIPGGHPAVTSARARPSAGR